MKIEHIAMYVNELESARAFFVKYLGGVSNDGYNNKTTGFKSYFISFDDGARLEIMNKPSMENIAKSINRTGYIHIAFSVGSVEEVDRLTRQFREDGFEVLKEDGTSFQSVPQRAMTYRNKLDGSVISYVEYDELVNKYNQDILNSVNNYEGWSFVQKNFNGNSKGNK